MEKLRNAALVTLCAAMPPNAALAANIEAELDKWYLEPCQQTLAASLVVTLDESTADLLSIEQLVEMMNKDNPGFVSGAKERFAPFLQNKTWEERRQVYKEVLISCVQSIEKNDYSKK